MTAQYTLHNRLGSGGFVVQAACAVAGIPLEYQPIESKPDTALGELVKGVNNWGQVPVLALADGTRVTELAAILAHLSITEPSFSRGPQLWIDNHPAFLRWSVFLAVNVYEGILRQSYTDQYTSGVRDVVSDPAADLPDNADALVAACVRDGAEKTTVTSCTCTVGT
ncbi:MAG: hypothetical protein AAF499_08355 [Pseudomonadota bacterium]